MVEYEEIIKFLINRSLKKAMNEDNSLEKAAEFAREKHSGQVDDNGKSYFFYHICEVVNILKNITNDIPTLAAAYLHDTLEDTDTTYQELFEAFGQEIADLVMEMTQEGKADHVGYYFPRLQSHKAIMIKFADRLSNLSRMGAWPADRQEHYLKKSKFWKSEP